MARITIDSTFFPRWKSPVTSGIRTAMAWSYDGSCPHDAVVKNVATTTSPTSSSKQSPRRSGTSTCGSTRLWIYQAPSHRCARCNYRQHIIPRSNARTYPTLIASSNRAPLADRHRRRRLPALENLGRDDRPDRRESIDRGSTDRSPPVITDIGLDELSLKKRHRLDVTLMTDLSDPTRPQILAVERGRDSTATLKAWIGSRRNNANRSAPIGSTWGRLIPRYP